MVQLLTVVLPYRTRGNTFRCSACICPQLTTKSVCARENEPQVRHRIPSSGWRLTVMVISRAKVVTVPQIPTPLPHSSILAGAVFPQMCASLSQHCFTTPGPKMTPVHPESEREQATSGTRPKKRYRRAIACSLCRTKKIRCRSALCCPAQAES